VVLISSLNRQVNSNKSDVSSSDCTLSNGNVVSEQRPETRWKDAFVMSFEVDILGRTFQREVKVKVKQSRYRPGVAQKVPGS